MSLLSRLIDKTLNMAGKERSNSQQQGQNQQQATKPSPEPGNSQQKRDDRQYIKPGPTVAYT